ncbi:MAG TPA: alpha-glucosidase/alpha-galactosidase [Armatimonadaceae bacterium]|nr:alpha-glucosidase/alpha-galactosidase [Armatimonadaceae bacterium]
MIKVAMIGAGSVVFSKNLTGDILSYPEFKDAHFAYMDIDADRLEVGAALCRKVGKALGATPTIEATLDRREALKDADFVINMVQIGGFDSTLVDFEIPRKYGLNFTIADTTGPGGLFRALRTYPMIKGMCEDMTEVCPRAILLNYSNPMSMNMQTISRTSEIQAVGLCHSVQGTFNGIMRDIGVNPDEASFLCAGINHMAFYQRLEKDGEDLYPRLFAIADEKIAKKQNAVRYELLKRLGYFVTESSEHNAEYCAHFIPHGAEMVERFDVPIDEYLRRCDGIVDEFERLKKFSRSDDPIEVRKSHEYGSIIIHSVVTGTPSVVYGNMPNRGAISNLPADAIAEVPTLVDRSGLQFTTVGDLPPQLIGYMYPHVTQHELFIRAAMEGRRDHVYQAAMADPLTAATMPPDRIVEMCDELIVAHGFEKDGGYLPDLDAKRVLVPTSGKSFTPPTGQELRASWDAAQKAGHEDDILDWKLLGPFPNGSAGITVEFAPSVEGAVVGAAGPDLGQTAQSGEKQMSWRELTASKKGYANLSRALGNTANAVAYAYARLDAIHGRETVLRCGSHDGIKVWLNGEVVHANDVKRGYAFGEDEIPVFLREGENHLVVKVSNHGGPWGFSVAVPKANF